jgi:hypothetical protein
MEHPQQLPFRTDGPFLVWLGLVEDERTLERRVQPLMERSATELAAGGLLRGRRSLRCSIRPAARACAGSPPQRSKIDPWDGCP